MRKLKEWSLSRLLLLAASVFAVAGVTALVLLLVQAIPNTPLFSDLFRPTPHQVMLTALSDEDKLAILATLSNNTSTTTEAEKAAVLESLSNSNNVKSNSLSVEQKFRILSTLSSANTAQ